VSGTEIQTSRTLPGETKMDLDRDKAIAAVLDEPSLIKRPVIETVAGIEAGFRPERYVELFGS
jgi:arsenate reductase-like glutaredoxin family protein